MIRAWTLLLGLAFGLPADAQTLTRQNVASILGFENNTQAGKPPAGWFSNPDGIAVDAAVVHSGKYSTRLERTASSAATFSLISFSIPVDFRGEEIEWRGFLKLEDVSNYVALWVREDSTSGANVAFGSTQSQGVHGTAGWKEYSITIPWRTTAGSLYAGVILGGPGKLWADDFQLLVDGQPIAQAAKRVTTVLDTDHEFDAGSGVAFGSLTDVQVGNLATLAKVWGFLKYHHPAITGGSRHWDYDLFRVLPKILAAPDAAAANAAMSAWIDELGAVTPCNPCATLEKTDLALAPNLEWISDTARLGAALSGTLRDIHANRTAWNAQFYVAAVRVVGNPDFRELPYPAMRFGDSGYQLLALFRFWNMVEYFSPNREIMADDPDNARDYWNQVLVESIPPLATAVSDLTFKQEMLRFIGRIHDTHANLWSSLDARPPLGSCFLPVDTRFVEGKAIVLRHNSPSLGPASGLQPGDVIERLDGVDVSDLVARWTPFYADSNQAARLRDMGAYLTRGPCGRASVVVERGGERVELTPDRAPESSLTRAYAHDLAGPAFQMLTPEVAYINNAKLKAADAADDIRAAAGAKGLIIDDRNYPSDFPIFDLGQLLVSEPTPFVRFTRADYSNPGAFHWDADPGMLIPQTPHFAGKVVILVDETTQSSAEYHAMAYRTAPGALVIGSTTAGADGNVSTVPLPGAMSSYISGIGVFYPDNRPTQRVGIVPDIVVTPTIEGIRAGRDEVLEEGIRQIMKQPATARRRPVR
jgi:C-terminal processing protease CtpA/Prc